MYQGTDDRIQDSCDSQDNGDEIQRHGEGQITFNCEHHPLGKPEQVRKHVDFIIYKGNICSVHSDITADSSHCNSNIGLFQSRRIVNAISHHADQAPVLLTVFDPVQLLFRKAAGLELVNVKQFGDMPGGILVISGQQNRYNPCIFYSLYGKGSILPKGI